MTELLLPTRCNRILAETGNPAPVTSRPEVRGKFLFAEGEKLWIRGVTYGTFAPDADGLQFPAPEQVEFDFGAMAAAGLNSVRVYTVPPRWLLDSAARHGLRVMVGLPWEQHIAFLEKGSSARAIRDRLRNEIKPCVGHPALLCFAIGNEIPATVVRWHGKRRTERFLKQLADLVREEDPTALVTYVNFPTTEYLELPFLDFHAFNVYLEREEQLSRYLARLQNIAGERPLVMAEVGLDSMRNGLVRQADVLGWQIRAAFEKGCAGTFIFAWTDEWYRGGAMIEDWDFGLTTRDREPKPALSAVSLAYQQVTARNADWPRISVVVCSYNGAATIEETLKGLAEVDYPNFEVIVVNDGSTDATAEIAARHDVRLISTSNMGLSHARNVGMDAATGEIIAYTDDDAYPDPDWLKFLALAYMGSDHAAIGGPNIPPPEDNEIAQCVANAPGGPIHVLLEDELAEHIPGCNMSFRADKLRAIGGFDPQFWVAGDDVDACWRIQDAGGTLGFCAAAMVWHHRRPSIRRYLKQQQGYARAEALLAAKWPNKYNGTGHLSWHGRLYGRGLMGSILSVRRLYHGQWGSAPFQSIYEPGTGLLASMPLMPEWYAMIGSLILVGLLGLSWPPLLLMLAVGLAGLGISIAMAARAAAAASFEGRRTKAQLRRLRAVVFALHLLQPVWRLFGRMRHGIGPWKWPRLRAGPLPRPMQRTLWSEQWHSTETRLQRLVDRLRSEDVQVSPGGDFDAWDLTIQASAFGKVRCLAMVEEHGAGMQFFRIRAWPAVPAPIALVVILSVLLGAFAWWDGSTVAAIALPIIGVAVASLAYASCAKGLRAWRRACDTCFALEQSG